jgi:hypothetical protein
MLQFLIGLDDVSGWKRKKLESRITVETRLFPTSYHANLFVPSNTIIEVFGAWEDMCIKSTVLYALQSSTAVYVPRGFTFKNSVFAPSLEENVLASAKERSLLVDFQKDEEYWYFTPRVP